MKYLILAFSLFAYTFVNAQSDIQIVKIKHEDRSVSVVAVNNSDIAYTVEVNISLTGMKLESPIEPMIEIDPKQEMPVALLIPTAEKTNYKINFRATATDDSEANTQVVNVPNITIYTKNGQDKSTELRMYLKKNDIPFHEINATYDDKSKVIYEKMLERRGIEKSAAKLPVVIIRGEVYYDIKDVQQFIKKHF